MKFLLRLVFVAIFADYAAGARILAVLPMPARSHHNLFRAVLKTLAERGHEVVSYTALPMDHPFPNYTEIHLDTVQSVDRTFTLDQVMDMVKRSPIAIASMIWSKTTQTLEQTSKCERFKELLASKEKFDLVFLEALFGQEPFVGFGHKFNAPVITFQTFGSFSIVNQIMGNTLSLAYIPDFGFPSTDRMNFYERFLNSYSIIKSLYLYYNEYLPSQIEYTKNMFKDSTMPSLLPMVHNISLVVNNAQPHVHYAQPYTPNILPVGGIHLNSKSKPLPPAMKKFLDEAKHGVVYFSLGSVLPDHLLPQDHFDKFIKAFQRLSQRVLWKTSAQLENLPENIMLAKWVPQQDVLAHPNVVLFVTHGGLFSQHEAINAGVPVVCIPFFGDQPMNAKFYEAKGVGVRLLFDSLSEQTIHSAITTVLASPKYKENMQRLSNIYRDRPLSPADSLVFWVEYVLRHRGAHHLRPASAHMPWYQLCLLDVAVVILTPLVLALVAAYVLIKVLVRKCLGGKKPAYSVIPTKKKN